MADYVPPLRDIRFVLEQLADLHGLSKLEAYEHADPVTVLGVIEESGRLMAAGWGLPTGSATPSAAPLAAMARSLPRLGSVRLTGNTLTPAEGRCTFPLSSEAAGS